MSAAVARLQTSDLDDLWARSEPDLELDEGRIRPVRTEPTGSQGGAVRRAIGVAAPLAAGLVVSASRWD